MTDTIDIADRESQQSGTASEATAPTMIPVTEFRSILWRLYTYIFSAAVFGYGIGVAMENPGMHSLIALGIGSTGCVAGYFLVRPYRLLAKYAIKHHGRNLVRVEKDDDSAR
ncbi:MAG TPA: hypothetical protein VEC35_09295 [Noviherbaspirillum sp.]|nr:hypothetical protein [Noviherbaspirillum sp.]